MRRTISLALLAASLVAPAHSHAQDCSECKTRRVIFYDNKVEIPRPSDPDSIVRYWNYFSMDAAIGQYLTESDPTRDCFSRLAGA